MSHIFQATQGMLMATLAQTLPSCTPSRPLLKRLGDDVGTSIVLSAWAAVLITLVDGRPEELYQQMVYAMCIGVIGVLIVDSARLQFWDDPVRRRRLMLPFLALVVVSAPVAHYAGCTLGEFILGAGWAPLRNYPAPMHVRMILFSLLGICATFLLIMNRERIERIQAERGEARARVEASERQAVQAQLRLLQAQIEPHMLFNTLANLQGLIAIDPARAGTMLDQLIHYLRATLGATRAESTTLAEEFAAIDAYLGLMAVRMGPRLSYRCSLPDSLRRARLPAMLLQPLVENAIIHGLEPTIGGGEIHIAAVAYAGRVEISVTDTGCGLQPGAARGHGVGVSTTRERLQALYGERACLTLAPAEPHGTVARLTLPLETI
nr:Histidine kinase [uncultured organism]